MIALMNRLQKATENMKGQGFSFRKNDDAVEVRSEYQG